MTTTLPQAPFYVPRPSDDFVHLVIPRRNNILAALTVGGQPKQPRFRLDPDVGETFWQGAPVRSLILSILTAGGQPKQPRFRPYEYDDHAVWPGLLPRNSQTIYLPTPTVIPPTPRYRIDPDVGETFWAGAPLKSPVLAFLTVGGKPPTPRYRLDPDTGETFWQGAPASSLTINLPIGPVLQLQPQVLLMM